MIWRNRIRDRRSLGLDFRRWLGACLLAGAAALTVAASDVVSRAARDGADRTISVVAERFTFVPSVIRLKYGETVELRLSSLDTNHGFSIPQAGVSVVVPKRGRGEARVLFRAKERGEFPFLCSKACGAGHTIMRGRIVVE